jgi:hypothetical protein
LIKTKLALPIVSQVTQGALIKNAELGSTANNIKTVL